MIPRWLDTSLVPFRSYTLPIEGHRMHLVDEGEGDPILFVHGTPSWSFEWRHAVAALRGEARCVAPDHLGFGLSDKPHDIDLRPEAHAARLLELVRRLDLRRITLVVHDFGGPIGLPVALEEPDRVRALVLVNTWMWAHGDRASVRWLSRLVASPLGRLLYTWLNASPRWIVPASFGDRSRLTADVHRHYTGPFDSRSAREAPWVLGCELAGSDPYYARLWARRDLLRDLPTTLLWGMADPAFGDAYLARCGMRCPGRGSWSCRGSGISRRKRRPRRWWRPSARPAGPCPRSKGSAHPPGAGDPTHLPSRRAAIVSERTSLGRAPAHGQPTGRRASRCDR